MSRSPTEMRRGHAIVDRHMPRATEAERDAAMASLDAFAEFIVQVIERIAKQEGDNSIRQNAADELDSDSRPTP